MVDKLTEYYKWYESEYAKYIDLNKLEKYADKNQIKWLKKAIKDFQYPYSSIWRYTVLNDMRYYLIPKKTEFICTTFRIFRNASSSIIKASDKIQYQTIYAILYGYYDDVKTKSINVQYVTCCPTFRSADGEYRHRLMSIEQLMNNINSNKEIVEIIENNILDQLKSGVISFQIESIYPDDVTTEMINKYHKLIDQKRYAILFYLMAWSVDYYRYYEKKLENHITESYQPAMFNKNDKNIYEIIIENYNDQYNSFIYDFGRFRREIDTKVTVTEVGQKLIPLSISDIENINSLDAGPWREIFISVLVGDFVINGLNPCFPLINDWFLIPGNSYQLWDNKVSYIKLDHSNVAKEIVKKLENSRKGTYVIDPINKKELYISYNMQGFSDVIEISMDFAETHMILADYTLCVLTEHMGRTVADMVFMLMNDKFAMNQGPMFSNFYVFSKYIFEFIHALFCLNLKEIIHGDLHLNNVTMFMRYALYSYETGQPLIPNPYTIFGNGDEFYIFPHYGRYACIIDYSRSVIGRNTLLKTYSESVVDNIMQHQRVKLIRILERDVPDLYNANKDKIHSLLISNPDTAYKLFMSLDMYKLSNGLLSLTNNDVLHRPEHLKKYGDEKVITKEILPWLEKINNACYQYLVNGINNIDTVKENINLLLMREFFDHAKLDKFEPPIYEGEHFINLVDYFNSSNPLTYKIDDYDKFPAALKFDYILENKIPTSEMGYKNYQENLQYIKKHDPEAAICKVQEEMINSKLERRGAPEELVRAAAPGKKEIEKFKKEEELITASEYYYST